MANKNITDSLEEAKHYLNSVEELGEAGINIADRITDSCKCFIHQPQLKDYEDFVKKIDAEFDLKLREAKGENEKEKDSYLKYFNMAQFIINLRIGKTQRMINFLDNLNQKL